MATRINGVAEATLYVSDLERATIFYGEILELTLTAAFDDSRFFQTGPHSTLILFDIEKLRLRKSAIPSHGASGQGHVAFAVPAESMVAWRERLIDHSVEIEHEQTWPQGTHSIYFRDPDGNSLELIDEAHYPKIWKSFMG